MRMNVESVAGVAVPRTLRALPGPRALVITLLSALLAAHCEKVDTLEPYLAAGGQALSKMETADGQSAFAAFRRAVRGAAEADGAGWIAGRIGELEPGKSVPAESMRLASELLRYYVVNRYGDRMVSDLRAIVGFRTFARDGIENWDAPEFVRQRRWLEEKALKMGFEFKSYDGRVDEITHAGPEPIIAILTHSDVQGVEGQNWSSPPWEAEIVDGKIIGRGTEDDKGPIIATLYAFKTLRDAGWPLNSTLRLIVSNGEESSWEEIPYYQERAPMPAITVGIDASYPVTHAQKGYGVVTIKAEETTAGADGGEWQIISMSGGSGLSIIPERGAALLKPLGDSERMLADLAEEARLWSAEHPPALLRIRQEGNLIRAEAVGKGGHSASPESGHNALGDLTAFLATLDVRMDGWGSLALFVGSVVGTETDGTSLGIAHIDEVMGALTVSLAFLTEEDGVPVARLNTRVPQGITNEEMASRIKERAEDFNGRTGAQLVTESVLVSPPHIVPTDTRLVSSLLEVWEEVTGTPGRPVAIGGGTQSRLFPNGVDFGPALDMEFYRGHGPDEYLTREELMQIAELTVAALWKMAGAE